MAKVLGEARRGRQRRDEVRTEAEAGGGRARARDVLRDARTAAGDVRTEGLEIVDNLREMGDSLRSNAERLLRDVQMIHSRDAGSSVDARSAARRARPRARPAAGWPPARRGRRERCLSTCPSSSRPGGSRRGGLY